MIKQENVAIVTLKKGEGRTIKAGGAWVFNNEIETITGRFHNGDLVIVHDFDGYPMGKGYINQNSKIRVRLLTRHVNQEIDESFFQMRLQNAWNYRKDTVDTSSCRLVFGEADFLPGIVIDKYEDVLVMECLTLGMERYKEQLANLMKQILQKDGIQIRGVYERSDAKEREKEGLSRVKGFIGAEFDTNVEITENGVRYMVDVVYGQKTGLDISEFAVEQATENAKRNSLSDTVTFRAANVLDELPKLAAAGEKYDVVILDPPAFTKSRQATKNAIKGYREINMKGLKLVKDGGYLATCSCSHFMTQELLAKTIREAARATHKRLRQVEFRTQAADHPILWAAEESYYLKFFIFQVVDEK